jgi:hypothetical protein
MSDSNKLSLEEMLFLSRKEWVAFDFSVKVSCECIFNEPGGSHLGRCN